MLFENDIKKIDSYKLSQKAKNIIKNEQEINTHINKERGGSLCGKVFETTAFVVDIIPVETQSLRNDKYTFYDEDLKESCRKNDLDFLGSYHTHPLSSPGFPSKIDRENSKLLKHTLDCVISKDFFCYNGSQNIY